VILACTVLIQITSVTDRRTDRQTPRRWLRRAKHSAIARKNAMKEQCNATVLTVIKQAILQVVKRVDLIIIFTYTCAANHRKDFLCLSPLMWFSVKGWHVPRDPIDLTRGRISPVERAKHCFLFLVLFPFRPIYDFFDAIWYAQHSLLYAADYCCFSICGSYQCLYDRPTLFINSSICPTGRPNHKQKQNQWKVDEASDL